MQERPRWLPGHERQLEYIPQGSPQVFRAWGRAWRRALLLRRGAERRVSAAGEVTSGYVHDASVS